MKITFLGTGPAEPVRRRNEVRTNSSVLLTKSNINLLIDCTPNFLEQVKKNNVKDISFALITHAHKDAIDGLSDLDKWIKHEINVFAPPRVLANKRFKKKFKNINLEPITPHQKRKILDFEITPFRVIHYEYHPTLGGKFPCFGYLVDDMAYAEDMEKIPSNSEKYFALADVIVIDAAMYFGRQIRGHLSTGEALQLIKKYDPEIGILIQAGHTYPSQKEAEKEISEVSDEFDIDSKVILSSDGLSLDLNEAVQMELTLHAFGSPGGKTNLVKKLMRFIPEHKTYVEAFAGGAALFWAKEKADKEVLNDFDSEISFAYQFIKNATEEQVAKLRKMNWSPSKEVFFRLRNSEPPKDAVQRFYRFFYLYGFSYGGNTDEKATYGYLERMRHSKIFDEVSKLKDRLKNVTILNKDYLEVIKEFDSESTFFYLDPPYPKEWPGKGKTNYFTKEDCQKLYNALKSMKGKFLLSINNLDWIRNMFAGFHIAKLKNRRTFVHRAAKYELIIYNYSNKNLSELEETGAADVAGGIIPDVGGLQPIAIWGRIRDRKKKRKIKYGEEVIDLSDEEIENLYVRKKGNKWCVTHSDGRIIKCFPTKEEADKMHKAIIISKIKRGKMQEFAENTHKDCANFTNECDGVGWCKLKKKIVKAGEKSCPSFKPKQAEELKEEIEKIDNLQPLLNKFKPVILINNFLSLVGSQVKRNKNHKPDDIDLHLRMGDNIKNYLERAINIRLTKIMDELTAAKLHIFSGDAEGSHDTFVPVYHLALIPAERKIISMKELINNKELELLKPYNPQKPFGSAFYDLDKFIESLK